MPINPLKIISSSNLVNTFCDLFRHLYMSPDWPVSHMKYCLVTSFIQVLCCLVLDSLPNMSHSALVSVCSKCVQVCKKLWNIQKKKKKLWNIQIHWSKMACLKDNHIFVEAQNYTWFGCLVPKISMLL